MIPGIMNNQTSYTGKQAYLSMFLWVHTCLYTFMNVLIMMCVFICLRLYFIECTCQKWHNNDVQSIILNQAADILSIYYGCDRNALVVEIIVT